METSDPAIFSSSLTSTHHSTPEGPAPLQAWPRPRSIEAFHFCGDKAGALLQWQLGGCRTREMIENEHDCGKDLCSSQSCLVQWYLGQKSIQDRILNLNSELMSCHPIFHPFSFQVYPISRISYFSSGRLKSIVSCKQVNFPCGELYRAKCPSQLRFLLPPPNS